MKTISIAFEDALYAKMLEEFVKDMPIPIIDEVGTPKFATAEDYLKDLVKGYIKTLYVNAARRVAKTSVEGTVTTAAGTAETEINAVSISVK